MPLTHWFRPPRHLLVIFLVIVRLPSTLLVVSGSQLMRQEETRAIEERQAQLADLVVAELRQRIADIDARLREDDGDFTPASARDDFVFAVFDGDTTVTRPAHRLLFYPVTAAARELPVAALTEVHDLHRRGDIDAELAAWRRIASAPEASWSASTTGSSAGRRKLRFLGRSG